MEHPISPAAAGAPAVIAQLQQSVQAWIDSDRILPADGSALLAELERAMEGLAGGDSEEQAPGGGQAPGAAEQAGITAFMVQVQALLEAGLLEIDNDPPPVEASAAFVALLDRNERGNR